MNRNRITCRVEPAPAVAALEFAAYTWPVRATSEADWPDAPGAVDHDASHRPVLLHFAPGRWLAPEPTTAMRVRLAALARAGAGTVVNVTGKWDALIIGGPGAPRLLACAVAIEAALDGRGCAALTLFDCPTIVTRMNGEFALWVQSSYTTDFAATVERFRAALESDA